MDPSRPTETPVTPVNPNALPPVYGTRKTHAKDRVLEDNVYGTPVDAWEYKFRNKLALILLAILLLIVIWAIWRFTRDSTEHYADITEHYKYGSIGSEVGGTLSDAVGGLLPPEQIFTALPAMFPDKLPGGYAALGFITEPGKDLPIGVTRRYRLGFPQVGLNCAVCHVGTYRITQQSKPQVVLGMPANRLKIQEFFEFIIAATLDPRFTADNVIGTINRTDRPLGPIDSFLYRNILIPRTMQATLQLKGYMGPLIGDPRISRWGPGRVDTFNPYKAIQFHWDLDDVPIQELSASSDYPALWNQGVRGDHKMELHWDGNNPSLDERNRSASLGAGVTPTTLDRPALQRVAEWARTLPVPRYPLPIDEIRAQRGAQVYAQHCTSCHGDHRFKDGVVDARTMPRLGKVEPWQSVGTDRQRLDSYTEIFSKNQYTLYPDSKDRFRHFRKTNGYANQPLDGIWLKAPYLHNGSVPTIRDLLEPPANRPRTYYRGNDIIDQVKLGFVYTMPAERGVPYTVYDTRVLGNGNDGHLWGTQLPPADKDAIVEYMKMF
jgi:hypothetical protein